MNRICRATIAACALLAVATTPVRGQATPDREGVRRAVLDYVEGFYEGDTAKLVRSIRPERGTPAPATAPKEITVFDVLDQTASAKLTAWWGTDYLLLAKYDGRWMIRMVMWQSPPR